MSEILQNKVHRTEEVKDVDFYAFSYYYDLAANVGLIGKGGLGQELGYGSLGRGPVSGSLLRHSHVALWPWQTPKLALGGVSPLHWSCS